MLLALDPICRTIATDNLNTNPDPDKRCHFSEDKNNVHQRCSKDERNGAFWCPTLGWAHHKHSKWGLCNQMCDKESGKGTEC